MRERIKRLLQVFLIMGGLYWFINVGGYYSWWAVPAGTMFLFGLDWRYGKWVEEK